MPTHSPEGEKHLRWVADRALQEFDHGGAEAGLASAMSDFYKDPVTDGVDFFLMMIILQEGANKSREHFEKAIMGFNL